MRLSFTKWSKVTSQQLHKSFPLLAANIVGQESVFSKMRTNFKGLKCALSLFFLAWGILVAPLGTEFPPRSESRVLITGQPRSSPKHLHPAPPPPIFFLQSNLN